MVIVLLNNHKRYKMINTVILYASTLLYTCVMSCILSKVKLVYNGMETKRVSLLIWGIFVLLPIILLYGLRENVGVDYGTYLIYYNYFNNSIMSFGDIFTQHLEPGYVILNIFAKQLFNGQYSVYLLSGIIIFGLLWLIVYQYKKIASSSWIIYVFIMCFFGTCCNIVRQSIAMMIIVAGYSLLLEKKYYKFGLICIIATLFHKSALLCIFLIFFDKFYDRIKEKIKPIIVIGSIFTLVFGNFIIAAISRFALFKANYSRAGFNISAFLFLLYVIPEIIFIESNKDRLLQKYPEFNCLISIFYLQIPFQFMDLYSMTLQRVSMYFSVLKIIIIPSIVNSYKREKNYVILKICMFLWYLLFFVMTEIILTGNGLFPYKMIEF